jgi:nitrogen regulatory protein P-II 1
LKKIVTIIKPFKLDEVKKALQARGAQGLTVTEGLGIDRHKGQTEIYRGAEYVVDFQPKIMLELVVADGDTDAMVDAIIEAAGTGKIGDGKNFVQAVNRVVRIRTGEEQEAAL